MNLKWSDINVGEIVVYLMDHTEEPLQCHFISEVEQKNEEEIRLTDKKSIGDYSSGWLNVCRERVKGKSYYGKMGEVEFILLGRGFKDEEAAMFFIRQNYPELFI